MVRASQQTLLWVLNSQDSGDSVELTTKTDFEKCDLSDFCLCSHLGIYEVYENFLQAVSTECGRPSTRTFVNLRPALVALGYVNPNYQSNSSIISLTWKSESKAETTTTKPTTCSSGRPKSCTEIQSSSPGFNSSRNCDIYPFGPEGESVTVLCDFETGGGGWTVIQKRSSGPKEEFYRNWTEYERGFGSVDRNLWIGLTKIHALTKNLDQELRIELTDWEGESVFAEYSTFSVSNTSDLYRLSIGGYSGTAGDSMALESESYNRNGMGFTTKDSDNDNYDTNCAEYERGGWWYNDCGISNLNRLYYEKGETPSPDGSSIFWYEWKNSIVPLQMVEMKVRDRR